MIEPPDCRANSPANEIEESEEDAITNFDRDRHLNKLRLKSTFEDIFTKYEFDFSNVGDEIDLETGEVIVNNGHLSNMHDEHDVGRAVADQCLRCLGADGVESGTGGIIEDLNTEEEEGEEEEEEEEKDEENLPFQSDELGSGASDHGNGKFFSSQRAPDMNGSQIAFPTQTQEGKNQSAVSTFESAALQALSTSIACQITQFLSSMRQSMSSQKVSVWDNVPPLPKRSIAAPAVARPKCSESKYSSSSSPSKRSLWALPRRQRMEDGRLLKAQRLKHSGTSDSLPQNPLDVASIPNNAGKSCKQTSMLSSALISIRNRLSTEEPQGNKTKTYPANTKRRITLTEEGNKPKARFSLEDEELIFDLKWNQGKSWNDIMMHFPYQSREAVQRRFYKMKEGRVRQQVNQSQSHQFVNGANQNSSGRAILESRPSSERILRSSRLCNSPDPSISVSVEIEPSILKSSASKSLTQGVKFRSLQPSDDGPRSDHAQASPTSKGPNSFHLGTDFPVDYCSSDISKDSLRISTKNDHTPMKTKRKLLSQDPYIDDELAQSACSLPQVFSVKRRRIQDLNDIWESDDELAMLDKIW